MRAETYEHDERVQARKSVAHAEEGSRTTTCSEAQPPMAAHASLGARVRFAIRRFVQCTGKKTPGEPEHTRDTRVLYSVWFKDTGGSRDTHEQTQEPHKPTSKPTPPTDSRARPHPNPGTHASPARHTGRYWELYRYCTFCVPCVSRPPPPGIFDIRTRGLVQKHRGWEPG